MVLFFYLAESTSLSLLPVDLAESTSLSLLPVVHRRRCPSFWGILDPVGAGLRHCVACGILVPRPGIESRPTAVKALSLNHWTAREYPELIFDFVNIFL